MKRAIVALLFAPLALLSVAPAAAAVAKPKPADGFTQIAGCISGADNVLASIVVDESLSLRTTDPKANRVQGITSAIDSLEQLAESTGKTVNVETSLSTFARSFDTLVGWDTLTPRTAEQLRTAASAELPNRDSGDATDYRQALVGAQRRLDSRAQSLGDPSACKVLLWFTDGALDVDEATQTAATEICQRGGIADAIRHDGINVVALALFTPGANVSQAQRDQLKAVAEGTGGSTTCGTVPISSDDAIGVYLPADDPASLQLLFAGAGALVAGGTAGDSVNCPSSACPSGKFSFTIDPGVAAARIVLQTDAPVTLTTPSGSQVAVDESGSGQHDGADVSVLQRGGLTTLNLEFDPYSAKATDWVVDTSAPTKLQLYWFWGAKLNPITTSLTAGVSNKVKFQLVDSGGAPFPPGTYKRLIPTVSIGGAQLPATINGAGIVTTTYELRADNVPASLTASATVRAITEPSGLEMGPLVTTARLAVQLPPAFPTVSPNKLDFGTLTGLGSRSATLNVKGSSLGRTQVCVKGSSFLVPGGDPDGSLISAANKCVSVAKSGTADLELKVTPGTSADGVAIGTVNLALESADGEHLSLSVPATLDMTRPVDEAKRWEYIAALTLLALLIPLLLLIGSNVLILGRFSVTSGTRVAKVPVTVSPSGVTRRGGGDLLVAEDLKNVSFSGTKRATRFPIEGAGLTIRASRLLSLGAPRGIGSAPGARKLVSGTGSQDFANRPHDAPVSLGAVDASFVAIEDSTLTDEYSGSLIVVVPASVDLSGARLRAGKLNSATDWRRILANLDSEQTSTSEAAKSPPREAAGASEAPQPTGATNEAPPALPDWLGVGAPSTNPTSPAPEKGRRRGAKSPMTPAQPSSTQGAPPDSDLPALPDFLRDKD